LHLPYYYILCCNKTRVKRKSILHIKRVGRKTFDFINLDQCAFSSAITEKLAVEKINTKNKRAKDNPLENLVQDAVHYP
jgi:hypothetical protein